MRLEAYIFDFDGTLVLSHGQVYAVLGDLAKEFGLRLPAPEDLRRLSTLGVAREMGVRVWQIPRFTRLARERLTARLDEMELVPGMATALAQLAAEGARLGVLSSNSEENITRVLRRLGVLAHFDFVHGGSPMLGKARALKRVLKAQGLVAPRVCYVGDEARDVEASQAVGTFAVAVSWGFQDLETLRAAKPDALLAHAEELVNLRRG